MLTNFSSDVIVETAKEGPKSVAQTTMSTFRLFSLVKVLQFETHFRQFRTVCSSYFGYSVRRYAWLMT